MQTCLLTGGSGFLGKTIYNAIKNYWQVETLGISDNNNIQADLSFGPPDLKKSYDWVIHNAGKAHSFPKNSKEDAAFFAVNEQGTINLIKALERSSQVPKCFIFISTVAVYGLEEGNNISEEFQLNGKTPYALSKIAAEQFIVQWCMEKNVRYVILRLPLVVGPNAPGNLGKITKAIQNGRYIRIKGNQARKSVVLATDVANLLIHLDQSQGIFNLTDGAHPYFSFIEDSIARQHNRSILLSLPFKLLQVVAKIGDCLPFFPLNSPRLRKMTDTLTFSDEKARRELGWAPHNAFQTN